jgi:hypothetical protein
MKAVSEPQLSTELNLLAERHGAFRFAAGRGLRTSLFRDRGGHARVVFVTNTTRAPLVARLETASLKADGTTATVAVDALDGAGFRATFGALEVPLSPHSVRMLELK